jgi:hypothetical protein
VAGELLKLGFQIAESTVSKYMIRPQQIVEAFPWDTAPIYLVRDNDGAYGHVFTRRVRAMGIRVEDPHHKLGGHSCATMRMPRE